jgi:hypothetical protein
LHAHRGLKQSRKEGQQTGDKKVCVWEGGGRRRWVRDTEGEPGHHGVCETAPARNLRVVVQRDVQLLEQCVGGLLGTHVVKHGHGHVVVPRTTAHSSVGTYRPPAHHAYVHGALPSRTPGSARPYATPQKDTSRQKRATTTSTRAKTCGRWRTRHKRGGGRGGDTKQYRHRNSSTTLLGTWATAALDWFRYVALPAGPGRGKQMRSDGCTVQCCRLRGSAGSQSTPTCHVVLVQEIAAKNSQRGEGGAHQRHIGKHQ